MTEVSIAELTKLKQLIHADEEADRPMQGLCISKTPSWWLIGWAHLRGTENGDHKQESRPWTERHRRAKP